MKLIITFSGRPGGNCDRLAQHIAENGDKVIHFRDVDRHSCSHCDYECFRGPCKYRQDGIYQIYDSLRDYDKVILIVPMYCGNPPSLYFIFNERCQDYFMHNDTYEEIIRRLFIIGIYGSRKETPDFISGFEKWFAGSPYIGHVLGIERHEYGQKMGDCILDVEEVRQQVERFLGA